MNPQNLGRAFALGLAFALGRHAGKSKNLATDAPKWITVKPNGMQNTGRPALIESETGQILGGMGGKFTGKNINSVHKSQMPVTEKQYQNHLRRDAQANQRQYEYGAKGTKTQQIDTARNAIKEHETQRKLAKEFKSKLQNAKSDKEYSDIVKEMQDKNFSTSVTAHFMGYAARGQKGGLGLFDNVIENSTKELSKARKNLKDLIGKEAWEQEKAAKRKNKK